VRSLRSPRSREWAERGGIRKRGVRQKIQLEFSKKGRTRFISHLELAHLFYRASKRAALPLSYSEGFHPMPRIIFARALSVGVESLKEVVYLELEDRVSPPEVKKRLNAVLPCGIEIGEAREVLSFSTLPAFSSHSVYQISLDHLLSKEEVVTRIQKALEEKEIYIDQERKGKRRRVDIRPLIERMDLKEEDASRWGVELVLRNEEGRTAKPPEVLETILGLRGESLSRCRIIKVE
jgi:radical SAM-linked protein